MNEHENRKIPVFHFITGGAGTGKSVLIKAIYHTLTRHFTKTLSINIAEQITVLLMAPTGLAAFNIGGTTIHSALGITTNENTSNESQMREQTRNTYLSKLWSLKVIIIDEVSMVGNEMLSKIDRQLKHIFGSKKPFGGISVMFFGDFQQLRPVKEGYVFEPSRKNDLSSLAGDILWRYFKIFRLTEIMRQKDDLKFAQALNNLAKLELTEQDKELFRDRIYSDDNIDENKKLKSIPDNCVRLFTTNAKVNEYNDRVINKSKEALILSHKIDEFPAEIRPKIRDELLKIVGKLDRNQTQGLSNIVHLKIGIRYMITTNIDVSDGLVNGTSGYLRKIDTNSDQTPTILWFDFENSEIGIEARFSNQKKQSINGIPLTPIRRITKDIARKMAQRYYYINRSQFPITPAEAITIHKSQGQTYDKVVVHLSKRMEISFYYTALSRARTANGLYLVGDFNPSEKATPSIEKVRSLLKTMDKQRELKFGTDFDINPEMISIFYHNYPYLSKHIPDIICDKKILKCNVLIFVETKSNDALFPGYVLRHQIKYNSRKPQSRPFGISIYTSIGLESNFIEQKVISSNNPEGHIEIIMFKVVDIQILTIYASPGFSKLRTIEVIIDLIKNRNSSKVLIIGDLNIDINECHGIKLKEQLRKYYIGFSLEERKTSTEYGSQIDLLFSNFQPTFADYYISLTTYHKPIFAII